MVFCPTLLLLLQMLLTFSQVGILLDVHKLSFLKLSSYLDFASFMISLFAIWMAAKSKSQRMSFGWHRAEVLGAITSVLMIWVVTGILFYMAVRRVINQVGTSFN